MTRRMSVPEAVRRVGAELEGAADPDVRAWWERYLKGEARFRGVRMAQVRCTVGRLMRDRPVTDARGLLALALALIARPTTEDKLAGVLVLAEHGLDALGCEHVERLAVPFARGHLSDWNSCDWYAVKALGPFVEAGARSDEGLERRARAVGTWRDASSPWQRRAGAVAFVRLAARPEPFDGFDALLLRICSRAAADPVRWSQTSAGWLLRELSRRAPDRVREFVDSTPGLGREARRMACARIEGRASRR